MSRNPSRSQNRSPSAAADRSPSWSPSAAAGKSRRQAAPQQMHQRGAQRSSRQTMMMLSVKRCSGPWRSKLYWRKLLSSPMWIPASSLTQLRAELRGGSGACRQLRRLPVVSTR
eukprot:9054444-Pyramimonas_sp.AAC.1